jgi:DNA transposition AAA+ family ATPase
MSTETNTAVVKAATPEIRTALETFLSDNNLTQKAVSKKLGCSESLVSQYVADKPVGNLAAFEDSVLDMLAAETRKRQLRNTFFPTYAAEQCFTLFDLIRAANDVGIIHSAPGLGKTESSKEYAKLNPTCIRVEIPEWKANRFGIAKLLYSKFDTRKQKVKEGKCEFLERKLRNSDRLIIIDNAQRVPLSGLRWVMDFNDATHTPFALLGNPDQIMARLLTDAALSSRVGLCKSIDSDTTRPEVKAWLQAAADRMVKTMWPEAYKDIRKQAYECVLKTGHLRRLSKQISHAIRLTESPAWKQSRRGNDAAFVYARSLLVNIGVE